MSLPIVRLSCIGYKEEEQTNSNVNQHAKYDGNQIINNNIAKDDEKEEKKVGEHVHLMAQLLASNDFVPQGN